MAQVVEEQFLRIRGTFIDIKPTQNACKTRSRSAPVPNVLAQSQFHVQSQYISTLTERAMCLSQKWLDANSETSTKSPSEAASDSEHNEDQEPDRASPIANRVDAEEKRTAVLDARRNSSLEGQGPPVGALSGSVTPNRDSCDHTMPSQSLRVQNKTSPCMAQSKIGKDYGQYKRINLSRMGRTDAALQWLADNYANPGCTYEDPDTTEITTLMICDIPCRRTIEQIIAAIDGLGFADTYNLVYMPSKRPMYTQNVNMGYVFVNFNTPDIAASFSQTFQNFTFPGSASKKLSYAKAARYEVNLKRYLKQYVVGSLLVYDEKTQVEILVD